MIMYVCCMFVLIMLPWYHRSETQPVISISHVSTHGWTSMDNWNMEYSSQVSKANVILVQFMLAAVQEKSLNTL